MMLRIPNTGLPPVVPALAGGTGSRPVVPVGLFLASSPAFSHLDLRTPVVPVDAPIVPAGVLYSCINSSLQLTVGLLILAIQHLRKQSLSFVSPTLSPSLLLDFIS